MGGADGALLGGADAAVWEKRMELFWVASL